MIPDHITVPIAVIGMTVLTLIASGLLASYQRGQAYKRLRIQRLMQGVHRAEGLLVQLAGVSLPRDIRVLLRQDIQDRYRLIARISSHSARLQGLIAQSEQRRNAEASDVGQVLPVPQDFVTFQHWQLGFSELLDMVQSGGLIKSLSTDMRQRYRLQLLERQADTVFGHFMNQADKCKTEGRLLMARSQVQQLIERLRALGINTEHTQKLQAQAEEAYQYLLTGEIAPVVVAEVARAG